MDSCFCCKREFEIKDLSVIDERLVCKTCNHLEKEGESGEDSV